MKALTAAFVLLACFPATAEDMRGYLQQTQNLVQRGQYSEALQRMVWFHEHALERDPSVHALRLTTALDSWKRLAGFYAPAQSELERVRDREASRVQDGGGNRRYFQDVVAINRALGEPERSLELFKEVRRIAPQRAQQYWDLVKDAVLEQQDYSLAGEYVTDAKAEFKRVKAAYDRAAKLAANRPDGGGEFKRQSRERFAHDARQVIDLAVAIGQREAAAQIQKEALEEVDDPQLRATLTDGLPKAPAELPVAEDPAE